MLLFIQSIFISKPDTSFLPLILHKITGKTYINQKNERFTLNLGSHRIIQNTLPVIFFRLRFYGATSFQTRPF